MNLITINKARHCAGWLLNMLLLMHLPCNGATSNVPTLITNESSVAQYRVVQMGSDFLASSRALINGIGQVVFNNEDDKSYFYDGNTFQDLGSLGGGRSFALGLNDLGQIVGQSMTAAGSVRRAFFWSHETGMIDIGSLSGIYTDPYAMNDLGQVVGLDGHADTDKPNKAFQWSRATGIIALNAPVVDGTYGAAFDINNLGTAIGPVTILEAQGPIAFGWKNGKYFELAQLDGTQSCVPTSINDLGVIVGYCTTAFSAKSSRTVNNPRAFIWTPDQGTMELNKLVPVGSPFLNYATMISNNGAILARTDNGNSTSLQLLVPVRPPRTGYGVHNSLIPPFRAITSKPETP